jgi:hypothetical protein
MMVCLYTVQGPAQSDVAVIAGEAISRGGHYHRSPPANILHNKRLVIGSYQCQLNTTRKVVKAYVGQYLHCNSRNCVTSLLLAKRAISR